MKLLTQNMGRLWSSIVINELIRYGAKNFFISPGQRNAPIIAAIKNHPQALIHLGIDERSQGYRALGFSKASGNPSVLVCTSGTALANYFPAVIEAKKAQVNLIVISADRPWDMVFSGANQTIPQENIFGNFVNGFLNLGEPNTSISPLALASSIGHFLLQSFSGPIHLNLPLREPLERVIVEIPENYLKNALELSQRKFSSVKGYLVPGDINPLIDRVNSAHSPLLVIGSLPSSQKYLNVKKLIKKFNWPFYLDICCGFKFEFNLEDGAIPGMDHPEVIKMLQQDPPDLIIHLGGGVVSKEYYNFLANNSQVFLVGVNHTLQKEDPSHSLDMFIESDVDLLAKALMECLPIKPVRKYQFETLIRKKGDLIDQGPLTYPQTSKTLMELIPEFSTLYIGNSTAIRSFDSFSSTSLRKTLKIIHHRGVSGIEGFLAAAVGASCYQELPLTLVLGDISFLYDLNSLAIFKEATNPIITLILNNNGGGIFSLLPIAQEKEILPYLITRHDLSFKNSAEQFKINYLQIFNLVELKKAYLKSLEQGSHSIIEVVINNQDNINIYQELKTIKI